MVSNQCKSCIMLSLIDQMIPSILGLHFRCHFPIIAPVYNLQCDSISIRVQCDSHIHFITQTCTQFCFQRTFITTMHVWEVFVYKLPIASQLITVCFPIIFGFGIHSTINRSSMNEIVNDYDKTNLMRWLSLSPWTRAKRRVLIRVDSQ